jgi:hypothetical protein
MAADESSPAAGTPVFARSGHTVHTVRSHRRPTRDSAGPAAVDVRLPEKGIRAALLARGVSVNIVYTCTSIAHQPR